MIYITGDCHGSFKKFTKKERMKLPFQLTENDYVVICGDVALLWDKRDKTLDYNLDWLSRLPFTILFVDGNHEGFTLLNEYPVEIWNGGKVHKISENIYHLMRGQVFEIQGNTFFTFGGASSHDIQGGVLDKSDPAYDILRREATIKELSYRILGESFWYEELPTEDEMQEGRDNLKKVGWQVDYVISHCTSTSIQDKINSLRGTSYEKDILTEYFEELGQKLQYKQWYCGHYHFNSSIDEKHTVLYEEIISLGAKYVKDLSDEP